MEKIDRLGWAVGFSLKTYGIRVGIRSNDPIGLSRACDYLPREWKTASSSTVDRLYSIIISGNDGRSNLRRFNLLYGDHLRLARSTNLDQIFDTFETDLRLVVAEFSPHRVFVHAGVVGWQGKAIVIPGRSYSGKSTLVAELVKAGATYYSDEYAVFDRRGRVLPFHKPLEMRNAGETNQSRIEVRELGGVAGKKPLTVALVVNTFFKENSRWRPRQLTPGTGVLALLNHTVSARRAPERALATLQQVAASAMHLKSVRGEAHDLAPVLLDRLHQKKRAR